MAHEPFRLDESIRGYYLNHKRTIAWGPVGQVTYTTKYSRRKDDGTKETYIETCVRVVEGTFDTLKEWCHRYKRPWNDGKAERTAIKMLDAMLAFKFLPPGRGLWAMGTEHVRLRGGAALNNCGFVSTYDLAREPVEPFAWMMDMMMVGVGVGFDLRGAGQVQSRYVPSRQVVTYTIPDSREGWVTSTALLLATYLVEDSEANWVFDYSKIRPAGMPLQTFGGLSAGPDPLINLHSQLRTLLTSRARSPVRELSSLDILDIMNMIGLCVFSGNIRRGAQIALGYDNDTAFMTAKADHSLPETEWRRASNNSIISDHYYSEFAINSIIKNGEPGFFWLNNAQKYGRMKDGENYADYRALGTNPCGEQTLEPFELCCLVETFMSKHSSLQEYLETLKLAYLYAKAVTLVGTSNQRTNEVMIRNRRIGCSQSGVARAFAKFGKPTVFSWSDRAYTFIRGLDEQYSSWLDVPTSIKKTTIKPSGTVSLLPGETPGIHYPHSECYIRRQRFHSSDPVLPALDAAGYFIEDDVYEKGKTVVVEFPVQEPHFDRDKLDVSMWEQVENAAMMQHLWADNQVSITVTFKPHEAKDIQRVLELHGHRLKSLSFLPVDETAYPQMVYEKISREEYNKRVHNLKNINIITGGDAHGDLYCDGDVCSVN